MRSIVIMAVALGGFALIAIVAINKVNTPLTLEQRRAQEYAEINAQRAAQRSAPELTAEEIAAKVANEALVAKATAEEIAAKVANEALVAKATALIPFVQSKQPERLATMQKALAEDVADFDMRFERYGDYISVFSQRLKRNSDKKDTVEKAVQAIYLPTGTPINLVAGRAPDRGGEASFYSVYGSSGKDHRPMQILRFPDVNLPGDDPGSTGGNMSQAWSLDFNADEGVRFVFVSGIAQDAVDDRIVFGTSSGSSGAGQAAVVLSPGGGPAALQTGTITYSGQWEGGGGGSIGSNGTTYALPYTGTTLSVPAGKGDEVFHKLLEALKAGAPK